MKSHYSYLLALMVSLCLGTGWFAVNSKSVAAVVATGCLSTVTAVAFSVVVLFAAKEDWWDSLVVTILMLAFQIGISAVMMSAMTKHWEKMFSVGGVPNRTTLSMVDSFHFSVTTLSTTGYGDIVPISDQAKLFANWTMLLGVAFQTVVVATTVARINKFAGEANP
jgi:Ion channel